MTWDSRNGDKRYKDDSNSNREKSNNSKILTATWLPPQYARRQAPVVEMLDSAIQRINHYPSDKY